MLLYMKEFKNFHSCLMNFELTNHHQNPSNTRFNTKKNKITS